MQIKALKPMYGGLIVTGKVWSPNEDVALRLIACGAAEEVKAEAPKKRARPRKESVACE